MATLMSCSNPCVFCCVSRNSAFGGRLVTLLMDHGTMSRLMFGLIKATQPPCKMGKRMRSKCALCCQKRSTITICGECKVHYRAQCIDACTCGAKTVC